MTRVEHRYLGAVETRAGWTPMCACGWLGRAEPDEPTAMARWVLHDDNARV